MTIVGDASSPLDLLVSANALAPAVVVVPLDDRLHFPGVCSHLRLEHETMTIIGISASVLKVLKASSPTNAPELECSYSEPALLAAIRGIDLGRRLT